MSEREKAQFDLEKDYYLGNYQSCINKANSIDETSKESTFYKCLSYYHIKKYDILEHELQRDKNLCVRLIGVLVSYSKDSNERGAIVEKLDSMLKDKSIDSKDDLSRIVISSIYIREKMYANALEALNLLDTLAAYFAQIGVYLAMNRLDLAERHLKLMQTKNDYATLTLLATAQVKLATGNAREARDIAKDLEDNYKATPLLNNIQAAASICMGDYDSADQFCKNSLDIDNDNTEALINTIHLLARTKSWDEIKPRHFSRLKALYPDNEFVKEVDRIETELAAV